MADEHSYEPPYGGEPAHADAQEHLPFVDPAVEQVPEPEPPPAPEPVQAPAPAVHPEVLQLSDRVQHIIDTAEQSAAEIRDRTEARVKERIAEADRAADNRVRAADEEAEEILEKAREEAHRIVTEAKVEADSTRAAGREDARRTLADARAVAKEVQERGTKVSGDLEALGGSLKRNAQTILRDVQKAHRGMLAQIDAVAGPEAPPPRVPADREPRVSREAPAPGGREDEPDVPSFLQQRQPRPPRRRPSQAPGPSAADLPDAEIEIPEFSREYVPQRHRRRR